MTKTPSGLVELGSTAPSFDLPNRNPRYGGDTVGLADFQDNPALLVVFMCNHCPYVIHIAGRLAELAEAYQPNGLGVVGISVNDVGSYPDDAPDKMTAMALKYGFTFPYLYDQSQQSARDYGAVCTPDLFLYDLDRKLVYHGQFDGSRPGNDQPVTGADIAAAIDSVLNHAPMPAPQLPSVGCSIKWKSGPAR
jgi:peroxiredoxin